MRPSIKTFLTRSSRSFKGSSRPRPRARKNELRENESQLDPPAECHCPNCKMMSRNSIYRDTSTMERKVRQVIDSIDSKTDKIFDDLDAFVALMTISSDKSYVQECLRASDMVHKRLNEMKFTVNDYAITPNRLERGKSPAHNIIFAEYFSSPTKCTLLIYTYLDVNKAEVNEGWRSDPFDLTSSENNLYGRGVSSGKGMTVCWLNAIQHWLNEYNDLPINIKIIVESLHEMGSTGLEEYLDIKRDFFLDVDYMVFGDNSWLNDQRPILSCSLAGWAHFGVETHGANKDLEGGLAGGLVYEPMTDLCHLMNSLVDNHHEFQISKINQMVKTISRQEWKLLESSNFSEYDYKDQLGIRRLRYEHKAQLLQHRYCHSNITMHGVEGCFSRPGSSTLMPMTVMGKFTLKLVPDQEISFVQAYVDEYLFNKHADYEMQSFLKVHLLDSCKPHNWNFDTKYTKAAVKAIERVYQVEPVLTTSIVTCMPIASLFYNILDKPVILLPYAQRTDTSHIVNESIPTQQFINFVKICAGLFHELSVLPVKCKCDVIFEYCSRRGYAEILESEHKAKKSVLLPKHKPEMRSTLGHMPDDILDYDETEVTKKNFFKNYISSHFRRRKKSRISSNSNQNI